MISTKPYSPWEVDEKDFPVKKPIEDQLKFLINYAVLAPSSHNTQPWLFAVKGQFVKILPNLKRTLGYSDRTLRELHISLGCALGNLLIAADHFGFRASVDYLPEDEMDNVAVRVAFKKSRRVPTHDLFPQIVRRVTDRTLYERRAVDKKIIHETTNYTKEKDLTLHFVSKKGDIQKISCLAYEASIFAFGDKYFKKELSEWVRSIYTRREDGIPLFSFGIPRIITLMAGFMVKNSPAKMQAIKDKKMVSNSPVVMIITAKSDTKESWLKAGKMFMGASLMLTKNEIVAAPMAGVVEYEPTRDKLMKLLKTKQIPLFFARVGYSKAIVHKSPRIPASGVIRFG